MRMRQVRIDPGHGVRLWPVLVVLLATILVPSACMLWFMDAAMRNEALAVRQRLAGAYRRAGQDAAERLQQYWTARAEKLTVPPGLSAPQAFERFVASGLGDGFIILDETGKPAYPAMPPGPATQPAELPSAWPAAEALELEGKTDDAAAAYGKIVAQTPSTGKKAQAAVAQARCLAKAGQKDRALEVLVALAQEGLTSAKESMDNQGRLIVPSASLFALQLMGDSNAPGFRALATQLAHRLNDYTGPSMPQSQRRFLMAALAEVDPSAPPFPTLEAEDLVADYLQQARPPPNPMQLSPSSVNDLWRLTGPGGKVIALLRNKWVLIDTASAFESEPLPGMRLSVSPPNASPSPREPFLTLPAGQALPGWTLRVDLTGQDPFALAAQRQRTVYIGTAAVGIAAIVLLALALTYHLGRQIRLSRLKNDLIATVSHELKTPLASMRLLIDTLLEGRCRDQQQAQEYFALIAKENERLSRLIDNFLNFSRMERNRRAFVFTPLCTEEILAVVMRALPDRITQPPCQFELDVAHDCPPISGDRDALVTVLLNLLDNAYKYSREPRHIALRACGRNGWLHLSVTDNGIGLSRRSARRVFDRFYQADRSLSREAGGCGLGLSIVKFIVEAHGGQIHLASRLGEGSTFTVKLPTLKVTPPHRNHGVDEGRPDGC